MVQGLWAVLLGRLTGRDDVVFGVTVAGRPAELAGVEQMVGSVHQHGAGACAAAAGKSLIDLLAELQRSQAELLSIPASWGWPRSSGVMSAGVV